MLRVVTPDEMRAIEKVAIDSGISIESLMEQAGKETAGVVSRYIKEQNLAPKAYIVCGTGNNGGDGYVAGRYLLQEGISVQVAEVGMLDPNSLVKKQRRRYEARGGKVIDLENKKITLPQDGVIVDALFGTGFHGKQQEQTIQIIQAINQSKLPIIAVDVPSGLNAELGTVEDVAIKATITCTMEYPKIGFFLQEGWNHVGKVLSLPIGLAKTVTHEASMLTPELADIQALLPPIVRTRNKYTAGHVVGLAGSHGMAGAALMTSYSALKSGAGIVHLLFPDEYGSEFAGQPLEVVRVAYKHDDVATITHWLERASACFIGPGLGEMPLLQTLYPKLKGKLVLDADALSWLAKTKGTNFGPLPNAILTPHLGELYRFFPEKEPVTVKFLQKCQELCRTNKTNLILKGGPTFVFSHDAPMHVIMQGDPGMATAGSGDVLTGILSSLLSQGLQAKEAMLLGTYLHGLAGQIAAQEETSYSMTAMSIIAKLSDALKNVIHGNENEFF